MVIVGGGAMGASVAWHLRELGVDDVVLLERDSLAAGSTSRSAGGIRAQFSDELNIRIALRSLEEFERMDGIDFRQLRLPVPARPATDDVALVPRGARAPAGLGVPSRELSVEEALAIVPQLDAGGLLAATYCELDGYASPESVVQWYARGLDVRQGCEVTGDPRRGRAGRGRRDDEGPDRAAARSSAARAPGRARSRRWPASTCRSRARSAGSGSRPRTAACPSGCR